MTTAQVVETSVTVNNNSPIQNYVHPDDQTQPTFEMTPGFQPFTEKVKAAMLSKRQILRTLSKDDDDGSENVAKKMNLRSFKLNRVYLDPLNMSGAGDFSWS